MTPVDLVKQQMAAALEQHGQYPDEVRIAAYTPELFAQLRPGDDYEQWRRDTRAVREYLQGLGIKVRGKRASGDNLGERATNAARRPYRLGLSVAGAPQGNSAAAIGWMAVHLPELEKETDMELP